MLKALGFVGIHGARKFRRWRGLLVETFSGWIEDKAPRLGAALAYYTVLALAPVLALVTRVWTWLRTVASRAVSALLFAMIYKVRPDVTVRWRDVWIGALLTAALFTLGRFAIGEYLGRSSIGERYGAAGSLVVVLVWVYFS